jgi:drug/metabolite transporter (DMT)-like permease
MALLPYTLVLFSALTHAYWNFLLKRSGGSQAFVGLSKLAEVVLFAPVFAVAALPDLLAGRTPSLALLASVGALLVLGNYAALALAYRHGDLSFVYPVSRGGILLFLPVLAYITLGERLDTYGVAALTLVVAGIFVLQLPVLSLKAAVAFGPRLRSSATIFALLAALTAACYTIWDKQAVREIAPFTYFYAYTAITGIVYAAFIWRRYGRVVVRTEWATHKGAILQVAFFNTFTYLLVLFALQSGTSSYVIALRQLSIAFGVFLGWWVLHEELTGPKRVGVALVLVGCVLVAFAH